MKTKTNLQDLLDKTGRRQYVDKDVLATAPSGNGTLEFFIVGKYVSDDKLEKEYESRDLVPAPLNILLEEDIKSHDVFDEKKFVATHWKDAKGNWCYAAFFRWFDKREVSVRRNDDDWGGIWWFAGVRKSASASDTKSSSESLSLELRVKSLENDMEKIKKFLII